MFPLGRQQEGEMPNSATALGLTLPAWDCRATRFSGYRLQPQSDTIALTSGVRGGNSQLTSRVGTHQSVADSGAGVAEMVDATS